jgi:hypothetical protein
MAVYADFSRYCYFERYYREKTENIGWIDITKPYRKAPPAKEFLDRLFEYAKISISLARGAHFCEICGPGVQFLGFGNDTEKLFLGMGEIRAFAANGVIFAAPNLIYHYVAQHQYAPPDEFVKAVLKSPPPPSPAYFRELDRLGLEWWETRRVGAKD